MTEKIISALFLEDDSGYADLVLRMLELTGGPNLVVRHFSTIEPATTWLRDNTPDVVLLDLNLPDSQGLDTLDKIMSNAPGVPIVILSGLGEEEIALSALARGAEEYLIKGDVKSRTLWRTIQFALLRKQMEENTKNAQHELESKVRIRTAELEATNLALRKSEERYRFLVETMNEGVILGDRQGRIIFINEKICQMLNHRREELLGRDVLELAADQGNMEIMQEQRRRRHLGLTDSYEVVLAKRGGERVYALFSSRPIINAQGIYDGFLAVVTDFSARKMLEDQLLQSQKLEAIGQLAAGIAHEINTPIQYVSDNMRFIQDSLASFTQLFNQYLRLRKATKTAQLFQEHNQEIERIAIEIDFDYLRQEVPIAINHIDEGLRRVSEIVRSMKEFTHPGPKHKTPTDINRLIENTILVARNEWKYVADVTMDLSPNMPLVPCIPGDLQQVILNILVNAAQAIGDNLVNIQEEKGSITVATRNRGHWVEIAITDTGGGIAEEVKRRVFDPFFTTKPVGKGTGQGLAIAYAAVVERHQGEISFDSEVGRGTTFVVRLPIAERVKSDV